MRFTKEGLALLCSFEGCSLKAYRDRPGGIWTLGWGCTDGVIEGAECNQQWADDWRDRKIAETEAIVLKLLGSHEVNDQQLSALVSFCYNVGFGRAGHKDGFQVLKSGGISTMLRKLLADDYPGAADEFPKWDHVGGQHSAGIARRRAAERALFLGIAA